MVSNGPLDLDSPGRDETQRQDLEKAFAEYVDRLNAGEVIDRAEVITEHPGFGEELFERLTAFEDLGSEASDDEPLGTLGDYTLRRQIGRGGMGVVYEAWENSMNRSVALKVLPAAIAADRRAYARFMREAQAAGQLNHPNLVPVHAAGFKASTPYYAMELIDGETLAQILARLRATEGQEEEKKRTLLSISRLFGKTEPVAAITESEDVRHEADGTETTAKKHPFGTDDQDIVYYGNVAKAFAGVAEGLQHAHSKKTIHRDIKPSNLILDREGRLRILDFGLARLEGQESLTVSGDFVGTPLYMSPEQARQRKIPIDHRTDVYSLGATMYEMLTWQPPFKGKDHQDTLSQIIAKDPQQLRKHNPRIPRELETIVLKCLRKDAGDRYGTAEALAQDLRRFVRGDPIEARPQSRIEVYSRRLWQYRWRTISAVCVCLLVVGLGLIGLREYYEKRRQDWGKYRKRMDSAAMELQQARSIANQAGGNWDIVSPGMTRNFKYTLAEVGPRPEKGQLATLVDSLNEAIDLVPDRPEAYYYKGKALVLLGRRDEACNAFNQAVERKPDFAPALFFREALLEGRGGLEVGRSGPGDFPPGSWQRLWVEAHRALEDSEWEKAAAPLAKLKRLDPQGEGPYLGAQVETYLVCGKASLEAGDYYKAIEDFVEARFLWREALVPPLLLGRAYFLLDRKEEADRTFHALHENTDRKDDAALLISFTYGGRGHHQEALYWAEKIGKKPLRAASRAEWLIMLGKYAEAESAARDAIGEDPLFVYGHEVLGSALRSQGFYKKAEAALRRALELRRENAFALLHLGKVLALRRQREEAIDLFEEALKLEPRWVRGYRRFAAALVTLEEFERTLEVLAKAQDLAPRNPAVFSLRGRAYAGLGDKERALEMHQKALELAPNDYDAHLHLGISCRDLNLLGRSVSSLIEAIERRPYYGRPYFEARKTLSRLKESECRHEVQQLIDLIEKQLNSIEDHPRALHAIQTQALACLHVPTEDNLSTALEFVRDALERSGRKDPDMLVLLGKLLFQKGHGPEAVRVLEEVYRLPTRVSKRWSWFLNEELDRYRQAVLPELPSYETVDAVLDSCSVEVLIPGGDTWRFFRGRDEPSQEPLDWTQVDFPDLAWEEGRSVFGYGDGDDATLLEDMRGSYSCLYIRRKFTIDDPGRYERLFLTVYADDGFLAYLNGHHVTSVLVDVPEGDGIPWAPASSVAFAQIKEPSWSREFLLHPKLLKPGPNVLALQGVNFSADNDDFSLSATLKGELAYDGTRDSQLLARCEGNAYGEHGADCRAYLRGRVHERAGRLTQAAREFKTAQGDEGFRPFLHLARVLRACEDPASAEKALRLAFERGITANWDLWELWIAISLVDLRSKPGEVLAGFPGGQAPEPEATPKGSSYANDLRWLLQQLQSGEDIRINCGGDEYQDRDGRLWSQDRFFQRGWIPRRKVPGLNVQDTLDDDLYLTRRFFSTSRFVRHYKIPLHPGSYRVTLYFAEVDLDAESTIERKFTAIIEEKCFLEDYRPKALEAERRVSETRVDDGILDIEFIHQCARHPHISAIEIQRLD